MPISWAAERTMIKKNNVMLPIMRNTVNIEIFEIILFLRIAIKDIFATLKNCD